MFPSYGIAAFLVISSIILVETKQNDNLRFVSVVFRHGDRAPDDNGNELYPNDPYLKNSFFPMGLGGLTNNGKRREYKLGTKLRSLYNRFLGDIYRPNDIVARSTDVRRTKMSLLLVLAGLYPPAAIQKWLPTLLWQPIPTTYKPAALDNLLLPEECPRYLKELKRVRSLPEVVKAVEQFRPLMNQLTNKTGKLINNTNDMWILYHNLMAEAAMGLKLPEWTNDIFPHGALLDGANLEYEIFSYNDLLKKLNGGALLKRMIDDMVGTLQGGPVRAKKMNLFAGHESNVAALLKTLGLYYPHVPEYSSAVVLELHTIDEAHYVRVLHYFGIPAIFDPLKIPGCGEYCPLDQFLQLLRNVTPTAENLVCPKNRTSISIVVKYKKKLTITFS